MILQCSHINKSFDGNTILDDISFHINEQEKTAIVGINGSGKSTLLKILMGEYEADSGEIIIQKDAVIGYLAQNQDIDSAKSILEEMQDAKKDVIALEQELNDTTELMNHAEGAELEKLIQKADNLRHRFELAGGYTYHSELIGVLKGLGFTEEEFSKPVSALSGGERTRVALGKMLLTSPDLIILDEPTNHLDMKAIHWLENYLSGYRGAVIIVAHDRYFLDKIVTKVVEIRQHKATVYQGNYSQFSEKKQAMLDTQMKQYMNQQAEIKHQEAVIAKLKSFNREKSIKRAESREKQLDKIERLEKPVEENTRMNLLFSPRIQSGNDVLSIEHLSKSFDTETLFTDISFDLKRGERVAIIGDNGSGKTTMVLESLVPALEAKINGSALPPHIREIRAEGIAHVKLIDATPIGINVRSTVATYAGVHDELRKLYAKSPDARQKGFKASDFSYNTGSLRCPGCDGTGEVSLDVQFLPDVNIVCPDCRGSRYARAAYGVKLMNEAEQAVSLPELMDMDVNSALAFCGGMKTVSQRLQTLQQLGLGYLTLGEETPSLSGGEAQRLKLASEIGRTQTDSVFVFDEPSIGLHPLDVQVLLRVFQALLDNGATVVVIEHDLDVIRNADYVIDMGPGGGESGGRVVATGTPEEIQENPESITGRYL